MSFTRNSHSQVMDTSFTMDSHSRQVSPETDRKQTQKINGSSRQLTLSFTEDSHSRLVDTVFKQRQTGIEKRQTRNRKAVNTVLRQIQAGKGHGP